MKEYYILYTTKKGRVFQLMNNYHEFNSDEWHLISFYRRYRNGGFEYLIGLLGFRLRIFKYSKRRTLQ